MTQLIVQDWFPALADQRFKEIVNCPDRKNCDSFLYEETLLDLGLVQPYHDLGCDFVHNGMKVDVKEIQTKYFNIQSEEKLQRYFDSIRQGHLTHFFYYITDQPRDRYLVAGDVVNITWHSKYLPAAEELKKIQESWQDPGSYYIKVKDH